MDCCVCLSVYGKLFFEFKGMLLMDVSRKEIWILKSKSKSLTSVNGTMWKKSCWAVNSFKKCVLGIFFKIKKILKMYPGKKSYEEISQNMQWEHFFVI